MLHRVISYERMVGVDASHGQKFEMDLTTLVYLRCQRLHEKWKREGTSGIRSFAVANNVKGAGKFDDIVVRLEYVAEGVVKNKLIFVQCKHLQKPGGENSKKKFKMYLSDEDTLKNYLKSYETIEESRQYEIDRRFGNKTSDTENNFGSQDNEGYNLKEFFNVENIDIELVLYSNVSNDKDCKLFNIKESDHNDSDPTNVIFNTAKIEQYELKLNKNFLHDAILKNQMKGSLSLKKKLREIFRVFIFQSEPEFFILEEVKSLNYNIPDLEILRDSLVKEVSLNFETKTQCKALTEEDDIVHKVSNFVDIIRKGMEVCDVFRNKFGITNIFSCKTIKNATELFETQQSIVIDTNFKKLETLIFLQFSYTKPVDTKILFLTDLDDEIKWMASRETKLYESLKQIYICSQHIVNISIENLIPNEILIQFRDCNEQLMTLADFVNKFSPETENYILEFKVCLQGETTDIKSICGDSWITVFDENEICDMLENKLVVIGTQLTNLDFYAPRTFRKEILKIENYKERINLWNIHCDCTILFSESDISIPGHDADYKYFKNIEEVRTFVQTFVVEDKNSYHLCSYKNGQLEWLFSFGNTIGHTRETIIDEDALVNETELKISILSDVAGMGKTTTLLSLAKRYKQNNPSHWVFFIELNKYLHLLKNTKTFINTDIAIKFLGSNLLNLKRTELLLFTKACKESGKVAMFFDAFDEISPDAEEIFQLLMLALKKTKIRRIIVSSRPNFASSLENRLILKSIKFLGFTTEEMVFALEGYWKQMLKTDGKRIEDYSVKNKAEKTIALLQKEEKLLTEILAIPLQIRMVALIYYESLMDTVTDDFISQIKLSINLADLYEQFLTLHAERFYIEKHDIAWHNKKNDQKQRFILDKLKGAEEVACQTIFPDMLINNRIDRSDEISVLCDDVGIITNKSPVVFLHRTVAEYLVAKFVLKAMFCKANISDSKCIHNLFIDEKFNIVRKFINSLLIGRKPDDIWHYQNKEIKKIMKRLLTNPIHVSASEGNMEIIRFFLSVDNTLLELKNLKGRTPLHTACQHSQIQTFDFLLSLKHCLVTMCDKKGNTVLHFASEGGDIEIMKLILQREQSVLNMQNNIGKTSLHLASCNGKTEAVKFLLSHNDCSVNICDQYGGTVLHVASCSGYTEIMHLILQRDPSLLNMHDRAGRTPLHRACSSGHTEAAKLLLSHNDCSVRFSDEAYSSVLHGASRNNAVEIMQLILKRDLSLLNMQQYGGKTPLHLACLNGKTEAGILLLSHNDCSVNICDIAGNTVIHDASRKGAIEIMQLILQRNQSLLTTQNNRGQTPLHMACLCRKTEAVKLLLSHNDCSVNICSCNGDTVLHDASFIGNIEIMQLIMQRDRSLINIQNNHGQTPLHRCFDNTKAAKLLLYDDNCSVNICDENGDSVLHVASWGGAIEIIQLILQKDQSLLNMQNNIGNTPLHKAILNIETKAAKILLFHNDCTVNICNEDGDTVLHIASKKGAVEIIQDILLKEQTPLNIQNNNGRTPLHIASYEGNSKAAKLLLTQPNCLVNLRDFSRFRGLTALDVAKKKYRQDIVEMILQHDSLERSYCVCVCL